MRWSLAFAPTVITAVLLLQGSADASVPLHDRCFSSEKDRTSSNGSEISSDCEAKRSRVHARVSAGTVALGQPFVLRVQVDHLLGSKVVWPTPLPLGADVEEVKRVMSVTKESGGILHTHAEFTLLLFDPTLVALDGFSLRLSNAQGTMRTLAVPSTAMTVERLVVELEPPVFRPLLPPRPALVRDWMVVGLLGGGALAMIFLLATAWYFRLRARPRRPSTAEPTVVLPPHQEALAALDALESSGRLVSESLKPVFQEMSEVLRVYLGRRFEFPATDKTSSEIRSRLRGIPNSESWSEAVGDWIAQCDLVKYAGSHVTKEDAQSTLEGARVLIQQTKAAAMAQPRPRVVARA